ncbi:MAG TPA: hypothetical protein VFW77_00285 [Candidatus Saccharimonadales bacterium]|nr:hypothetical protein [Candidatus Saccharimonadales bacterium]
MGAVPTTPPIIPGGDKARFERAGSTAEVLPFRRRSTLAPEETVESGTTAEEADEDGRAGTKLFNWAADGRTKEDLAPDETKSRRTFRPGSVEQTTLEALRRYGTNGRNGSRGGSSGRRRR